MDARLSRFLLTVLLVAPCGAQEPSAEEGPFSLKDFRSLLQTPVVTASLLLQKPWEAPAKIVVITGEEIRRRGYQDLEEALHDLAGFNFEKGMGTTWSQIYMRGERTNDSDRFLFLWDDLVMNDLHGNVTWLERQFPMSAIEHVEILYGPASLLYGTNAMSGIVHVITRRPEDLNGVHLELWGGPYATRIAEVAMGRAWGDFKASFTGRYLASDERDLNDEYWVDRSGRRRYYGIQPQNLDLVALAANGNYDPAAGAFSVMKNGRQVPFSPRFGRPSRLWFMEGLAGWGGWQLRAQGWYREEQQEPRYTAQAGLRENWNSFAYAVNLDRKDLWGEWESKAHFTWRSNGIDPSSEGESFSRDKAFGVGDAGGSGDLPKVTRFQPYLYLKLSDSEVRAGERLSRRWGETSLVLGTEFTGSKVYESYNTRNTDQQPWKYTPQHEERDGALYGDLQGTLIPSLRAALGLRYDHNWTVGEAGGFGDLFTSRAAIIWAPGPHQLLKFIKSQAFQNAVPQKKYSVLAISRPVPSPNLRPERLESFEVGWELRPSEAWSLGVNAYRNEVQDKIDLVATGPGTTKYENVGRLKIQGFEVEFRRRLGEGTSLYFSLDSASAKDPATGRRTGGIAPLQARCGVDLQWTEHWTASLRGHATSARETADLYNTTPYGLGRVDPYFTLDLALAWRNPLPGLDLRLDLYNLGNARYYDPGVRAADGAVYNSATLQLPFRAYLGLAYHF